MRLKGYVDYPKLKLWNQYVNIHLSTRKDFGRELTILELNGAVIRNLWVQGSERTVPVEYVQPGQRPEVSAVFNKEETEVFWNLQAQIHHAITGCMTSSPCKYCREHPDSLLVKYRN